MQRIFLSLLLLLVPGLAFGQSIDAFTQQFDSFLKDHVRDGHVDYPAIKEDFRRVDGLYQSLAAMKLASATDQEKKAFYINAYNLIVIHQVAKFYPLQSPMDQSGFFDRVKHPIAGQSLTLNGIEISKLIIPYQDPQVHFALACAAKGCPKLANEAYLPTRLAQQLESRTRLALNDPNFIRVNAEQQVVKVNKIFEWYRKDFTQTGLTVLQYINRFRREPIPEGYALEHYEYDWSLNI